MFPTDVYFERRLEGFSDNALPRAKSAQLKLEHYYKIAVDAAIERNTRCVSMLPVVQWLALRCIYVPFRRVELERRLQGETLMSEERKLSSFSNLGKKESTFLRLRRTKFGLDDFRTIKVIGKGAFGEVSFSSLVKHLNAQTEFFQFRSD